MTFDFLAKSCEDWNKAYTKKQLFPADLAALLYQLFACSLQRSGWIEDSENHHNQATSFEKGLHQPFSISFLKRQVYACSFCMFKGDLKQAREFLVKAFSQISSDG
jgi:hypothetical protein